MLLQILNSQMAFAKTVTRNLSTKSKSSSFFCSCCCNIWHIHTQNTPTHTDYLQLIDGYPAVGREALQHGHQELQTPGPVAHQQHHADQVEDPHEHARHVQELKGWKKGHGLVIIVMKVFRGWGVGVGNDPPPRCVPVARWWRPTSQEGSLGA